MVQYLEKYRTTAGIQELAPSEQARITDWKQKRRWEMVELKDCQQQELEGKLLFHSLLTFSTCCITAAVMFASEYPGPEIRILYHCILYSNVRPKSLPSCLTLRPYRLYHTRLLCPWDSAGKNTGVGCYALFQGIFLTQGSNPHLLCLLHWQADSLPLSCLGSPVLYGKVHKSTTCRGCTHMTKYTRHVN